MGEGFAGFGPEEAAADATVFFDREGEGEEHLDVLLNVFGGVFVEVLVVEGFGEPRRVEAEVDTDVPVLFESGIVEAGAKANNSDGCGLPLPEGIECCGFGDLIGARVGRPEIPSHLELVSGVVVELLGCLGYCIFDEGGGGVLGAVVVDVKALVGGGFVEADWVGAGGPDAGVPADEGELAHDRDKGRGEGVEAEVGEPEA